MRRHAALTAFRRRPSLPADAALTLNADEIAKLQKASATIERKGGAYEITSYAWVPGLKLAGLSDTRVRVEEQSTTTVRRWT